MGGAWEIRHPSKDRNSRRVALSASPGLRRDKPAVPSIARKSDGWVRPHTPPSKSRLSLHEGLRTNPSGSSSLQFRPANQGVPSVARGLVPRMAEREGLIRLAQGFAPIGDGLRSPLSLLFNATHQSIRAAVRPPLPASRQVAEREGLALFQSGAAHFPIRWSDRDPIFSRFAPYVEPLRFFIPPIPSRQPRRAIRSARTRA
jgi:hypothetical protein